MKSVLTKIRYYRLEPESYAQAEAAIIMQSVQLAEFGTGFKEKRAAKPVRVLVQEEAQVCYRIYLAAVAGPVSGTQSEG